MKKIILILIAIAVIVAVVYSYVRKSESNAAVYQFGEISRGNIENLVSSTGTLNTVASVEVGTQLSGVVDQVLADYNDNVKKGEVLAVLDTLELSINFKNAQSDLQKVEAQLELTSQKHNDNEKLFEKGFISELDFQTSLTEVTIARANVASAQSVLDKAELKLKNYAVIRSPISGKVIDRSIEPGQTVASSLSAPVLFLIAENMDQMEIEAYVDESDIGMIQPGQQARFSVEAYPEKEFSGTVEEIRLQPQTISNVVNYTVIVSTRNEENLLLPGMTATLDFVVEQKLDVVSIPTAALNFQPDVATIQSIMKKLKSSRPAKGENAGLNRRGYKNTNREMPGNTGKFWYFDAEGELAMQIVQLGATDGVHTEVTFSRSNITDLKPIIKQTGGSTSTTKSNKDMRIPGMGRM